MKNLNNEIMLSYDDYHYLNGLLNAGWGQTAFDRKNSDDLKAELRKATIVSGANMPADVVRLNSKVTIQSEDKNEVMELRLVSPDKANIKEKKISILAPIGTALIGFRKGQKVKWKVPAGNKIFKILEVNNQFA
jgi:regulator of nucleoside diphosphate kinase